MTPIEKAGYLANLNRVKAQHAIHLGKYNSYDHRAVYELWLAAWGDEDAARKAQSAAAEMAMERACDAARRR